MREDVGINRANAAIERATKYLSQYPASSAAGIVRDLRDILVDMKPALTIIATGDINGIANNPRSPSEQGEKQGRRNTPSPSGRKNAPRHSRLEAERVFERGKKEERPRYGRKDYPL